MRCVICFEAFFHAVAVSVWHAKDEGPKEVKQFGKTSKLTSFHFVFQIVPLMFRHFIKFANLCHERHMYFDYKHVKILLQLLNKDFHGDLLYSVSYGRYLSCFQCRCQYHATKEEKL